MIVRGALYVAHDEPGDGDLRPALSAGPRGVRGQPRARRGARLCGLGGRRRGARRRPLGRLLRSAQDEAVEPRHPRQPLQRHEGVVVSVSAPSGRPGQARPRRAAVPHVAGDRTGRQRGAHRRARAVSPRRAPRAQRAARPRGVLRLGRDDERARRAGAVVGAGDPSRVPPAHLRVAGWRDRAPRRGGVARRLPPERRSPDPSGSISTSASPRSTTCAAPTSRTRRGRRGA
jgi:hypothetical protein